MTYQVHGTPKTCFLVRMTNENYDFLCLLARLNRTSLAETLNRIVKDTKAVSQYCGNSKERVTV